MIRAISPSAFLLGLVLLGATLSLRSDDWLQWRGPSGKGLAAPTARPPENWTENVKWKAFVPGRGHATPVVAGDLVVVATATADGQFVIAYDRKDGGIRWKARPHEGGLPTKLHKKNTAASSTVASDGERFFAVFHNRGRIMVTALDRSGEQIWQVDAGPFKGDYGYGYAASPTIHGDRIIVVSEHEKGFLAAFRTADGSEVWRTPRHIGTSYSSPIVANVGGREQLLLSGNKKITSYDPVTGSVAWEADACTPVTSGTPVWSEDAIFASGGFPNKETIAIRADGSGEVLWKNEDRSYEQSLLYHDGHLYTLNDGGIALCWDAKTGEEKWKVRLGGPVSASPILAGGLIYATNERGITHVFRPDPEQFEKVAEFQLGDEGFATPVFVDGEVFLRTAEQGRERKEFLYCISR